MIVVPLFQELYRPTIEILNDSNDDSEDKEFSQPNPISNIPIEMVNSSSLTKQPQPKDTCSIQSQPLFTKSDPPKPGMDCKASNRLLSELQDLSKSEVAKTGSVSLRDCTQKPKDQTTAEKILELATYAGSTGDGPATDVGLEGLDWHSTANLVFGTDIVQILW